MQAFVSFSPKPITNLQNLLLIGLLFAFSVPAIHAQTQWCAKGPLVPKCYHPYLGAYANNYKDAPPPPGLLSQFEYHEDRIGRNVSIAHAYNSPAQGNQDSLSKDELILAKGTGPGGSGRNNYLLVDLDVTDTWQYASGCSSGNCQRVDGYIDTMAGLIKGINNKVFVGLGFEPQRNVGYPSANKNKNPDPIGNCSSNYSEYKGSAGSTRDYVNMWNHVRSVFAAKNVTNVVWVLIYQSDQTKLFNCLVKSLYPGDSDVDWVAADIYDTRKDNTGAPIGWHTPGSLPKNGTGIADMVYTEFSNDGFGNKPWMVSEFGSASPLDDAETFYREIRDGLEEKVFPNFQAYLVFDDYCSQIEYSGPCTQPGTPPYLDTAKQGVYINQVADYPDWHLTPPWHPTSPVQ
jgi:hypothetical protein